MLHRLLHLTRLYADLRHSARTERKEKKIYKAILLERAQSTRLMTLTGVHTPLRHGGSTYGGPYQAWRSSWLFE